MKNYINIVYASDSCYVPYMGISMISVMENNKDAGEINFYVLSLGLTETDVEDLKDIVQKYRRKVIFVDVEPYISSLILNMPWEISKAAYARLFIGKLIPCERVLYLDCDTIVTDNLETLWNTELSNIVIAGVRDIGSKLPKLKVGLCEKDEYVNTGVLLINVKLWKEMNIDGEIIHFINKLKGNIFHHDQGVINAVLHDRVLIIAPRYNLMTGYVMMKISDMAEHYKDCGPGYTQDEIDDAISNPAIIHFTPFYTTRPWEVNCKNPKKYEFDKYKQLSPWRNKRNTNPKMNIYTRINNWGFNTFSYKTFKQFNRVLRIALLLRR